MLLLCQVVADIWRTLYCNISFCRLLWKNSNAWIPSLVVNCMSSSYISKCCAVAIEICRSSEFHHSQRSELKIFFLAKRLLYHFAQRLGSWKMIESLPLKPTAPVEPLLDLWNFVFLKNKVLCEQIVLFVFSALNLL